MATAPFRFRLNRAKAIEATAEVLRLAGGVLNIFNVVKTIYFADRKSIEVRGRPICGGRYTSMLNGPVPKDVYTRVTSFGNDPWGEFFEKPKTEDWVKLAREVPIRQLSEADRAFLHEAYRDYGSLPFPQLWAIVHNRELLPEHLPQPSQGSEEEITVESLLAAVGRAGDFETIREEAEDAAAIDEMLPQVEV